MNVYTLAEAAQLIGVSRQAIHKAIVRKAIKARRTSGGYWLIEESALADYKPKSVKKNDGEKE